MIITKGAPFTKLCLGVALVGTFSSYSADDKKGWWAAGVAAAAGLGYAAYRWFRPFDPATCYGSAESCFDKQFSSYREGYTGIDDVNRDGETLLVQAINLGEYAVAKYLIDRGANLYIKDHFGNTAISLIRSASFEWPRAYSDDGVKLRTALLAKQKRDEAIYRAKVLSEALDMLYAGNSLSWAVKNQDLELVKALLQQAKEDGRVDEIINETDAAGFTPLMHGSGIFFDKRNVRKGMKIVELLLANGADLTSRSKDSLGRPGRNALDLAKENGNDRVIKFLSQLDTLHKTLSFDSLAGFVK